MCFPTDTTMSISSEAQVDSPAPQPCEPAADLPHDQHDAGTVPQPQPAAQQPHGELSAVTPLAAPLPSQAPGAAVTVACRKMKTSTTMLFCIRHAARPSVCANCKATQTRTWRHLDGVLLCNACGLYTKTHGVPRPASLIAKGPRRTMYVALTIYRTHVLLELCTTTARYYSPRCMHMIAESCMSSTQSQSMCA